MNFPESEPLFNAKEHDWGFKCFMPLAEFRDPRRGFLAKDTCIIRVEVSVLKLGDENEVEQAASITACRTSGGQAEHTEVPQPEDQGQVSPVSK